MELLVALGMTSVVIAATAGFLSVNRGFLRDQGITVETNVTTRLVADVLARDLRLAGACLPVNGEFVALTGNESGDRDEVTVRTGMTRADLTCIRSATSNDANAGSRRIDVESTDGFDPGMRAYIRSTAGNGEFFTIEAVNDQDKWIRSNRALSQAYLATSGVYAVDERRYFIEELSDGTSRLMMQIGEEDPVPFAAGVEGLDIQYQLKRNCPTCDVVAFPTEDEWPLVEQLFLAVRVRSEKPTRAYGGYYRRTLRLAVKPRNLLPQ